MNVLPFRRYAPDPRNGEVYATASFRTDYIDGAEIETPNGFIVVHMSRGGDSASVYGDFNSIQEAEFAAFRIAREQNAVLA